MGLILVIAGGAAGLIALLQGANCLYHGEVRFSPKTRLTGRSARIAGLVTILAGVLIVAAAAGFAYYARNQL